MNKNVKIAIVGGVLALGTIEAYAATACTGTATSSVTGASTNFVKDTFTPKCSGGVILKYNDGASYLSVKAGSTKGMHTFGGGTDGGGVTQCESSSISVSDTTVTDPTTVSGCA